MWYLTVRPMSSTSISPGASKAYLPPQRWGGGGGGGIDIDIFGKIIGCTSKYDITQMKGGYLWL